MKRCTLSAFAVLFALAFSAFSFNSALTTVYFQGDVKINSQVQNPSLWCVSPSITCSSGPAACKFDIDDQHINTAVSPNCLNSNLTISTSGNSTIGFQPVSVRIIGQGTELMSNKVNKPTPP